VIGHPVRHSLSPAIFEAAFEAAGLDWTYVAFEIDEPSLDTAFGGLVAAGVGALSVTMPHKTAVAGLVDALTPAAADLGAVNCVRVSDRTATGGNTDGEGFVAGLAHDGIEVAGMRVGILGAGGAARAIIRAVHLAGAAEMVVVNRNPARAAEAANLGGVVARAGHPAELSGVDLIVNATPVGMGGSDALPVDPAVLEAGQIVVDTVYYPLVTPLLAAAAERGARPLNGLGMLVGQAAAAFEWWTGLEPPVEEMRRAAEDALAG
jgi:shikimate dehydrogenase